MIPEKKSPPLSGVASCLLSSSAASAAEDRRMHIATTKLKRWLFIVAGTIKNEMENLHRVLFVLLCVGRIRPFPVDAFK